MSNPGHGHTIAGLLIGILIGLLVFSFVFSLVIYGDFTSLWVNFLQHLGL